jgi:glycosyltransferase involved in cell wall biosynthesis
MENELAKAPALTSCCPSGDAAKNAAANKTAKVKWACFVYYMQFNNSALLYREAKALQSQGFEIDIIDLRSARSDRSYRRFDGMTIYGIQARPEAEKKNRTYFARLLLFHLKATLFLSWMSLKKKYSIIHVTSPPDFMVFTAVVPKFFGAKIILDIHDISPELFMEKLHLPESQRIIKFIKFIEAVSARYADHVITVTDLWRNKLVSRSVAAGKCTVLLNVPDENLFAPASRTRHSANDFNLFYHGSLEEYFGVDTLLKAMPTIRKMIPTSQLFIYGGGRLEESFAARIKRQQMESYIKMIPKVPFYELPILLQNADMGIVPTKSCHFATDTISMKSLEYMSLGIPIVISRTKAHHYYFDDSMVKFFEPDDAEDLAKCVIALFKQKDRRESQIQNSQEYLRSNGWPHYKNVYLQIVNRLVSNEAAA